jgi:hypothetical protein
MNPEDLAIQTLGNCSIPSPLANQQLDGFHFIDDRERILFDTI